VAEGLSYITETELAGPAPVLLDLEPIQTEGEVSMRVSDLDLLFFESEPTCTGRRQKCRDMSGLSQCLCGETVTIRPRCRLNSYSGSVVDRCGPLLSSGLKRLSRVVTGLVMCKRSREVMGSITCCVT
jgi:hypothetical protein